VARVKRSTLTFSSAIFGALKMGEGVHISACTIQLRECCSTPSGYNRYSMYAKATNASAKDTACGTIVCGEPLVACLG